MKYLIRKCKTLVQCIRSHLVLAIHVYVPEQTVTLTKYYRNIVHMVNGMITSYMCIKHLNKL